MEPILQVKDLTHTYGAGTPFQRSAVEHMSFDVNEGEFLGIIGHTGSGKSTLIQHLNGLLQPTAGEILLRGKNIWAEPKKIREVRFKVGLVFQYPEYQLFEETVYKDIAFGPANQGKTGDELDHAVREAAKLVGIRDDQLEKSPFELSGGQKRRVALAGVLAMEPEVLVLDEPTAGLDPAGRENLMANIRDCSVSDWNSSGRLSCCPGDFRKLLLADSSDRQKIMEQLFQTGIYLVFEKRLPGRNPETEENEISPRRTAKNHSSGNLPV